MCVFTILQDSSSTIQLGNNGKEPSTEMTRYINILYIHITSKMKNGGVRMINCPSKEIASYYLGKNLDDAHFLRTGSLRTEDTIVIISVTENLYNVMR